MLPAAALIVAYGVDRQMQGALKPGRILSRPLALSATAIAVVQVAAAIAAWRLLPERAADVSDPEAVPLLGAAMVRYARLAVGLLAAGATGAAVLAWRWPSAGVSGLVVTMAAFAGLTWEVGMPAYDRAVGIPLRRAVVRAAGAASDGTPLAVHIGRPRRPSAFFYMPARMLSGPLPSDPKKGLLLEAWEASAVRDYVRAHHRSLVLSDHARGTTTLAGFAGVREVYRCGRWALFSVEPGMAQR
jgi:hypothetical protein